jgi:DNA polymerase-3 subunit alpha
MAANMHNDYADRKNGRKPVEYLHPDAEEILGDTYGLMIYQESVMRIAQRFAGYSLAEADNLRKACGKKIRELIAKEREKFVAGCEAGGYGAALGESWFDIIEPFADYAFNKSHSYGYGLVAYQTAFLKANHYVEYLAALLTSVKTNLDKAAIYLHDCRVHDVPVRVPDINRSLSDFEPVRHSPHHTASAGGPDTEILFGLSAVRNVGEGLVELIVSERDASGPFTDFYDFCNRVEPSVLNKRTVESLIKAGAFDSMGHPRQGLLEVHEQVIDRTMARRRNEAEGQFDLFGAMGADDVDAFDDSRVPVPDHEFDKRARLAFEREMLGLYVSDHPLMGAERQLGRRTDLTLTELESAEDGAIRNVGGLVTNLSRKWTRKGDLMAVFVLEDLQSSAEVMVFPRTMQQFGHVLAEDGVVVMKARVDKRDDQAKLVAMEIEAFEPLGDGAPPLRLQLSPNAVSSELLERLGALLAEHPGDSDVYVHLGSKILRLPGDRSVSTDNGLMGELRVMLGPDAVLV